MFQHFEDNYIVPLEVIQIVPARTILLTALEYNNNRQSDNHCQQTDAIVVKDCFTAMLNLLK